jgi:hypothetical protein
MPTLMSRPLRQRMLSSALVAGEKPTAKPRATTAPETARQRSGAK